MKRFCYDRYKIFWLANELVRLLSNVRHLVELAVEAIPDLRLSKWIANALR